MALSDGTPENESDCMVAPRLALLNAATGDLDHAVAFAGLDVSQVSEIGSRMNCWNVSRLKPWPNRDPA